MKRTQEIKSRLVKLELELPKLIQPEMSHIQNLRDFNYLFARIEKLENALEWISDETKRDHREPDLYTKYGCVIHKATEALKEEE